MARVTTSDELALQRTPGDWSRFRLAIHLPQTIFTARVNGIPDSNDLVNEIDFDGGTGTLADIHDDMTMYVGTTAGSRNLGEVRLRKAPTSSVFYFGETSSIDWVDNAYLTVVDHFAIRERAVRVTAHELCMDSDIVFSDQHIDFDPVPVLGPHIVAEMTGADVDVTLGPPADTPSWVFDDAIDSVLWEIPDASAIDDATAVNPVVTFDSTGWHVCYCVVNAENGKSFEGVRYVYIWNVENPPARAFSITEDPSASYADGGWSFGVDLYDEASLGLVRDGALAILFAEDRYGATKQSLGPIEGRENIVAIGWIAGESIEWDPETGGAVRFVVQGPQYWMKQNTKFPLQLFLANKTPDGWNIMPGLTVARALWHVLHWRFNITKLMDVMLTDDTRRAKKLKSTATSLWGQLNDIAWNKIFARPGCDRYARLWVEIDPQMVPVPDRTWPVVQTITKKDWSGKLDFDRVTKGELSILFMSGEKVSHSRNSIVMYSQSPGHQPLPYGDSDIIDGTLVSGQAQGNRQAGLYLGWKNNEYPDIPLELAQNNRMIDLWPRQHLDISIAAEDTVRGISYAGNLVPRSITFHIDAEAGTLSTNINCEAETFPALAINGDIPEDTGISPFDQSIAPIPDFPGIPDFDYGKQPPTEPTEIQPKVVVIATSDGVFYTENFDADPDADPEDTVEWVSMSEGLSEDEMAAILKLIVTPGGALFVFVDDGAGRRIYCATGLGGAWTLVADGVELDGSIVAMGFNPYESETVAFVGGEYWAMNFHLADRSGYSVEGVGSHGFNGAYVGDIVFSGGRWIAVASSGGAFATPLSHSTSPDGSSTDTGVFINTETGQDATRRFMKSLGGQDRIFQWDNSAAGGYNVLTDEGATATRDDTISPKGMQGMAFSPTGTHGMAMDDDTFPVPYRTIDGGDNWEFVAATIPVGSDVFESCGDDFRFIIGGGATIRLTMDQGETYIDKMGNLSYISSLADISEIRFIR